MNDRSVAEDLGKVLYEGDKILVDCIKSSTRILKLMEDVARIPFEQLSIIAQCGRVSVPFLKKDEIAPLMDWIECKIETMEEMKKYIPEDKQKEIDIQLAAYKSMLSMFKKTKGGSEEKSIIDLLPERIAIPLKKF